MTVAVNATYENGVLKPEGPLALKEQAKVRVIIQSDEEELPAVGDDDPTGWKVARELIGCISDAPEDVAEHHDKYLYAANDIRRYGVLLRALLDHAAHNARVRQFGRGLAGRARLVRVQQTIS